LAAAFELRSAGGRPTAVSALAAEIPRSLQITGTVAEWESWTELRFRETGDYVFPAGLATVHIDRDQDLGEYWEPNIWIIHPPTSG